MNMATPVKKVPIHLQSSQNRLLIKNGTVVNDDGVTHADVYIEDCVVKMVGNHLIIPGGTRVIDASDKLVLPGGVDASVHMHKPHVGPDGTSTQTIDDFYSVTRAAVVGG
jgi:dihydropyrimidinase